MKDQLISYYTAKLAKEKGFDVNTYSNCWVKTLDNRIIHNSEIKDTAEDERCEQYLMQPTQTLLQKWLREKREIDITISLVSIGYRYYIHKNRNYTNNGESYPFISHIYEEVLEKALQTALNLI